MSFEWPTIVTACEEITIMAISAVEEGQPVLMRTVELEGWFRMFAITSRERWKAVIYAVGGYRADARMVMRKSDSAHSGQITTSLIAAIGNHAAATEDWGDAAEGQPGETKWARTRRAKLGTLKAHSVTVLNYQHDLSPGSVYETPSAGDLQRSAPAHRRRGAGDTSQQQEGSGHTVRNHGRTHPGPPECRRTT